MSVKDTNATMAVYLDLENIVLGAQDAHYPKFEIQQVLERLLLKGHIVTKKAYCDWDRYKELKRSLHEAAFELIEIPHTRQSGKNSADIRMVVDALDLCYTKGHVDTFVIISGDSDFSPLVSKLRENAKTVIGMGVKNSTSNLFISNCDEFIYYDDLVRKEVSRAKRIAPKDPTTPKPAEFLKKLDPADAIAKMSETVEAIAEDRDADDPIWGSMIKQAIKRRDPGFNERAFGFRSFNALLEEAQNRGALTLVADKKTGNYLVRPKE
ncbi:hypothetical protein BH11VER1_BH11VER1_31470 [soil metagenome]